MGRLYLDLALDDELVPELGDVIRTSQTDRRIVDVWPTESREWPNRWTLTLGPSFPRSGLLEPLPRRRLISTIPYRRGEGPADFYGPAVDGYREPSPEILAGKL